MLPKSIGYLIALYDEYCVPTISHTTSDKHAYDELKALGLAMDFGPDSWKMKTRITPKGVRVARNILDYAEDQFGEING